MNGALRQSLATARNLAFAEAGVFTIEAHVTMGGASYSVAGSTTGKKMRQTFHGPVTLW